MHSGKKEKLKEGKVYISERAYNPKILKIKYGAI